MYVGVTRARDYLVFPTRKKPTSWLNRVWHEGDEKVPALDENSGETQWEWGDILYKETWVQAFPKDFTHTDPKEEQILFLGDPAPHQNALNQTVRVIFQSDQCWRPGIALAGLRW